MSAAAIALNRFGLGARPDEPPPDDPRRWLLAQFDRFSATPTATGRTRTDDLLADYQNRRRELRGASDADKQAMRQALRRDARAAYVAAANARLDSAVKTPTPFVERLVHFWSNHFAVSVEKPAVLGLAGAYENEAIRPFILGRFDELLRSAVRHPAMLVYLDQAQSIGPDSPAAQRIASNDPARRRGLNENLAREIMELHTLGARTGYTQADVTEFARALTGWTLAAPEAPAAVGRGAGSKEEGMPAPAPAGAMGEAPGGFRYRNALHEPGPRTVLGRVYAQPGEQQARAILDDLAVAPATARHIASKLAIHFVSDNPPPALIDRLAAAFERSRGDLPTVYRALVDSPECWATNFGKFKTPWDWTVSSMRALGPPELRGAQAAQMLDQLGQPMWRPGSPAGFEDFALSWAAPDALVRRVELAQRLAAQAGRGGATADPRTLASRVLPGDALGERTRLAVSRAESAGTALALLLVSPDFLRR
ncbi:MAG: DUF1800 domain-containing protein [Gammaproteobacteria bacterium]|nr:DUF1800 domain-containing protein [Gammaproteobacteria bacterium]